MIEGQQVKAGAVVPDHNIREMLNGARSDAEANAQIDANTADIAGIQNTLNDVAVLYGHTGTIALSTTVTQVASFVSEYDGGLLITGSGATGEIDIGGTTQIPVDVSAFIGISFPDKLREVGLYLIQNSTAEFLTSFYQGNQVGESQTMQFNFTHSVTNGDTFALGLAVDTGTLTADWVRSSFKIKRAW